MDTKHKITTVLFDLDDTLSDHLYSLEHTFRVIQNEYPGMQGREISELMDLYQQSLDETFPEFLAGKITHKEAKQKRVLLFLRKLGSSVDDAGADLFLVRYNEIYMSDRRATLGAIKTLETLRSHGYKIGVVTNGGEEIQIPKLKEIGIDAFVDVLIASGAVGFSKPDPEIFRIALERMQSTKEETIMIGDNLRNDIEGALEFGIQALYYSPNSTEESIQVCGIEVPVIHHMEQVLTHLGITGA